MRFSAVAYQLTCPNHNHEGAGKLTLLKLLLLTSCLSSFVKIKSQDRENNDDGDRDDRY